ncbi:MAG TPA: hypothetical protein VK422_07570 [Pyrinomonadaceae bacterium]|nr:hypothetical protein [Pyrinomonadaceae bacterium]
MQNSNNAPPPPPQPQKGMSTGVKVVIVVAVKGQTQMLNVMLASRGKDFARHEDALYGILYSTKLAK